MINLFVTNVILLYIIRCYLMQAVASYSGLALIDMFCLKVIWRKPTYGSYHERVNYLAIGNKFTLLCSVE